MSEQNLPQWLYVLRVVPRLYEASAWNEQDSAVISLHFSYLQQAAREGRVFLVGRTDVEMKDNMGLAIFSAASEDEARHFMQNDPAVVHGLMTATLYPFRIAIAGRALQTLGHT